MVLNIGKEVNKMKKKAITVALLGMFATSAIAPMAAYAADDWVTGYFAAANSLINQYYHSDYNHSVATNYRGYTYRSEIEPKGSHAVKWVTFTGPYKVYYYKYIHN